MSDVTLIGRRAERMIAMMGSGRLKLRRYEETVEIDH